MGFLDFDCPHCRVQRVAMPLFGFSVPTAITRGYGRAYAYVAVSCAQCGKPLTFHVRHAKVPDWTAMQHNLAKAAADTYSLSAHEFEYELIAPPAERPLPEHLPIDVAKALAQAEQNFWLKDCEEPAAVFFGRAIELALKFVHADVSGSLAQRIGKLATSRVLPQAMADWANEVRIVRNDGAHDDGVTRPDLEAARDFTDAFLRYLITMPKMVDERRAAALAADAA